MTIDLGTFFFIAGGLVGFLVFFFLILSLLSSGKSKNNG